MNPKLTTNGYALMLKALDGVGIQFSKVVIGNGEKPEDYRTLTQLQNPILSAQIAEITRLEHYAVLRAPMDNSAHEGRLSWTELGVFVTDPDGGDDILYGYAHAELDGDGGGVSIPAYDTNMVELSHIIYVYVGEVDDVSAILIQSSEYAGAAEFRSHVNNHENPHGVTKDQVGLGNVPNVTPEDQQPVYSEDVTAVTETDGVKSLPNISSKEKMGSILQKVRSAIAAFLGHLNAKNPHGLAPEDISAAKSTHYHSASDINKGTLSLLRGGTGGTTAAEARKNLDAAKTDHAHTLKDITDALSADDIANLYIWKRYEKNPLYTETSVTNQTISVLAAGKYTLTYGSDITISNGTISLVDQQKITLTDSSDPAIDTIKGQYVNYGNIVYYLPSDTTFNSVSSGTYTYSLQASKAAMITANAEMGALLQYVASSKSDTYPTKGEHTDGYWYEYHKQLGE